MKLGFIGENSLASVEKDAAFARDHGFAGLEYNYWGDFRQLTRETVDQMRAIHDTYGVKASSIGIWGFNHISRDDAERAEAHELLDRAIEFGKALGADVLITGGGDLPGEPLSAKVAEYVKVFPAFLDKIAAAGMQPAMYAVHGNSFFVNIEAYEAVWEHLPQVGIKYDPANWNHAGEDYLDVVRRHGDKVTYVHIKEHLYYQGELASQPAAGMGDITWGKVFAFLYEHGYDGYLSFEPHGPMWSQGALREKMLLLSKKYLDQFLL